MTEYKKSIRPFAKGSKFHIPFHGPHPFEVSFQEIRRAFRHEHLLRNTFRKLLYRWLQKRYGSRLLNKEDPSTLCEPEQPIQVYDNKSRGVYIFESIALKRQFDSQLGNNKWMFPEPSSPRNPLTNVEFTLAQLLSILPQLKHNTHTSWLIEAFCKVKYNINDFLTIHKVPLKLHALEDIVAHRECEDLAELVEEFMEDEADYHSMKSKAKLVTLMWAFEHEYSHHYIRKWHFLYRDYMKKLILFGNQYYAENLDELDDIHERSRKLLISPAIADLAEKRLSRIPKAPNPEPQQQPQQQPQPPVQPSVNLGILTIQSNDGSIDWEMFETTIERMINELIDGTDTEEP